MSSISIKKSAVAGKIPAAADLEVGELAANFPDQKLYTKDVSGNIITLAEYNGTAIVSDPPAGLSQVITAAAATDASLTLRPADYARCFSILNPSGTEVALIDGNGDIKLSRTTGGLAGEVIIGSGGSLYVQRMGRTAPVTGNSGAAAYLKPNAASVGLYIESDTAQVRDLLACGPAGQSPRAAIKYFRVKSDGSVECAAQSPTAVPLTLTSATGQTADLLRVDADKVQNQSQR